MNTPPNKTSASLKKLARKLLTTTCLTAIATGAAQATTFNESTITDFSNNFPGANVLPAGTDRVIGGLSPLVVDSDFFKWSGLLAGDIYTLTSGGYVGMVNVTTYNSAQGVLNAQSTNPATLTGIIPGDGMLVVGVTPFEGTNYDFSLKTNSPTPEPATFAGVGLALAGALALRSKSKK